MLDFDQFVFLGGGHLSTALIAGLLSSGCPPEKVRVLERNSERRAHLLEVFGVVAGESVPRSVENILLNGHAHLLAAYCAMAMDSTAIPPVINGHHFAPAKINSILSMIDIFMSSSSDLMDNLPLPKGYVDAFRRCKIQCEKNVKANAILYA